MLRTLLGVREGDAPAALYKESLVEELASQGYPKALCTATIFPLFSSDARS